MKAPKIALSFLAAMTILAASDAHALSIKDYEAQKSSSNAEWFAVQGIYLMGVFNGLTIANLELGRSGQAGFFCDPVNIQMNADNLRSIIDDAIAKARKNGPINEELATADAFLFIGLRSTFPCN